MALSANAKSFMKALAELAKVAEDAEKLGCVDTAVAEAQSRLEAARRDGEILSAQLEARANAAAEAEQRADAVKADAEAAAAAIREAAAEEAKQVVADAKAAAKKAETAGKAKLDAVQDKIKAAEADLVAAQARAGDALLQRDEIEAQLAALRAKLGG